MRRIGLISDTHNCFDAALRDFLKDVDEIWHAGDIGSIELADEIAAFKPLRAVYGNIDGGATRYAYSDFLHFKVEDVSVLITHIGGYPGRYDASARTLIDTHKPDIFVCGHSHILKVMRDPKRNMLVINPGAAGVQGFHVLRTALRFRIENGKISDMEVFELDRA
jgi:putative phosphoesterase